LGLALETDAYVFSLVPDHSEFLVPPSVTQRYRRLVTRLAIDTHFHALRHYSATELIASGVDIRTVAGRLGHSGGGITTLRVYSAWREEADQRAASTLSARMPARPVLAADPVERAKTAPRSPYQCIAAKFRERILNGSLPAGALLPPVKQIAAEARVSVGTAHRALVLLQKWHLIEVQSGRRTVVRGR
jgi:Transcriptional regulators